MANINEILARAAALRNETALNSIDPERAGGIMYDTLLALNELWLQQGAALVISKIYASVAAMNADTSPVSDLTGKPIRPGMVVVIASSDSDNGSVYRYNGTSSPRWSLVGKIGNITPEDSLTSDSTQLPLAAHQGKVLDGKISQLGQSLSAIVDNRTIYKSFNLYDSSKQTSETISPHYFVYGEPYSSTQFDNQWNCTDFIPIKGGMQYSIGLVPAFVSVVKPWYNASYGLFFYNRDKQYISGTTDITFTTPVNAAYIRFNYAIGAGVSLSVLNARCMLVSGDSLPSDYEAFSEETIKDKIHAIESTMLFAPIGYKFSSDALEVYYKHNDIILYVKLDKHGGNNLFDFKEISKLQSFDLTSQKTVILGINTDWHAPFIMAAVNDIDGDNINSETGLYNKYFTGGNHTYNNTGSGASATARTANLKVYADGVLLQNNDTGFSSNVKIEWENYVQAYNTTKADGTGREVLKEIHTIVFNGKEFETHVELVPLEEVVVDTWYGFQYSGLASFNKTVYIGGSNRAENTAANSTAGNYNPTGVESFGSLGKIRFVIDSSYDMGDRRMFATTSTQGAFVSNSKAYMWIIFNKTLNELNHYFVRGRYVFDMV